MISRIRHCSSPAFQNVCHWSRGLKARSPASAYTTSSPSCAPIRPWRTKLYSSSRECRCSGAHRCRGGMGGSTSANPPPASSPQTMKRTPSAPKSTAWPSPGPTRRGPCAASKRCVTAASIGSPSIERGPMVVYARREGELECPEDDISDSPEGGPAQPGPNTETVRARVRSSRGPRSILVDYRGDDQRERQQPDRVDVRLSFPGVVHRGDRNAVRREGREREREEREEPVARLPPRAQIVLRKDDLVDEEHRVVEGEPDEADAAPEQKRHPVGEVAAQQQHRAEGAGEGAQDEDRFGHLELPPQPE